MGEFVILSFLSHTRIGFLILSNFKSNKPKMAYSHDLPKMAVMDDYGLSGTIMDNHELSTTIIDYYG